MPQPYSPNKKVINTIPTTYKYQGYNSSNSLSNRNSFVKNETSINGTSINGPSINGTTATKYTTSEFIKRIANEHLPQPTTNNSSRMVKYIQDKSKPNVMYTPQAKPTFNFFTSGSPKAQNGGHLFNTYTPSKNAINPTTVKSFTIRKPSIDVKAQQVEAKPVVETKQRAFSTVDELKIEIDEDKHHLENSVVIDDKEARRRRRPSKGILSPRKSERDRSFSHKSKKKVGFNEAVTQIQFKDTD